MSDERVIGTRDFEIIAVEEYREGAKQVFMRPLVEPAPPCEDSDNETPEEALAWHNWLERESQFEFQRLARHPQFGEGLYVHTSDITIRPGRYIRLTLSEIESSDHVPL